MPFTDPQQWTEIVEGVRKRDGRRGYLVRKHWVVTAWWIGCCALAGAVSGLLVTFGDRRGALATMTVLVLLLWYWRWVLTRTFLLITPRGIYYQHISSVWTSPERDTRVVRNSSEVTVRIEPEGWNLVRSKLVDVMAENGEHLIFRHAGGGDEMSGALNAIIGTEDI